MRRFFSILVVSVILGGCAVGNTYRYDLGDANIGLVSDKTVAVTVVDLRPYVLSGEKSADFVGLMRGGFGNPFDVTTSSKRSLADDIAFSIVESLKRSNIQALSVAAPPKTGEVEAQNILLKAEADRFTLLAIREWKSDTYFNTSLNYDVSVKVMGRNGATIAGKTIQDRETLGVSGLPADARRYAEKAVRQKLETIFNDPEISSALK